MKPKKHIFTILPVAILLAMTVLFGSVLIHPPAQTDESAVQTLSQWQMGEQVLSLPQSLSAPTPRTGFTIRTVVEPSSGDYLYLKTVYAPLKVYADDALIFEYGQAGSYPAFLLDPPTKVALIAFPETSHAVTLTMEYLSPSQRNSITLHPVLVGTSDAILRKLFSEMGFSLFFSIVLLALGMILVLVSLVLTRFEGSGISFLWLGLFALCTGCWVLGECNLTGLFIDNPSLLYLMAFLGLFTLTAPLLRLGLTILGLRHSRLLKITLHLTEISVFSGILLQFFGIVSLSRTVYFFHLLLPGGLCVLAGCILYESLRYQNTTVRRFLLPELMLALFSLVEAANYYFQFFNSQKSFFFQIGVLVFLVMVSVQCGYSMGELFTLRVENQRLAHTVALLDKQIEVQKERYRLLTETAAQIRQQRHDFKHHIAVIRSLQGSDSEELSSYLDALYSPAPDELFEILCANEAVNAVALYYRSMAQKAGVSSCVIQLDIPEDTGLVPVQDICVVVGNLLENAVTACRGADAPFIHMQSRCADGILTITMDNSYTKVKQGEDGAFISEKNGGGIGLLSIRTVSKKYGGGCRFEAKDGVFASSVYLHLH